MEKIWNHNFAYFKWIKKKLGNRKDILDVGCGNGNLLIYLNDSKKNLIGIDPSDKSINYAKNICKNKKNINFLNLTFEEYLKEDNSLDAVIFVASIHHMDMEFAIKKALKLLKRNGILIIVGLSTPSNIIDYLIEFSRIIPCFISSHIHKMKDSEDLNIKTSYKFPTMNYIRKMKKKYLPNSKIRYGLYYRYLLTYVKE